MQPTLRLPAALALLLAGIIGCSHVAGAVPQRSFRVVQRFAVPEARQGVAVDGEHFYAVGNRDIGKYDKHSGERVRRWEATGTDAIVHLNSGVVIDGKLYCAHSNYPDLPMVSSVEIFDARTLTHIGSQALKTSEGSLTWVDRRGETWWGVLANYKGRGGQPGKGPAATTLVRFDRTWGVAARYTFPAAVVERFGTRSNSGGAWGSDGLLYATGHDGGEIDVLRLPPAGSVLELAAIISAAIDGQGIAWDRGEPGTLYGIVKKDRSVVVLRETDARQSAIDATSGR